MNFEPTTYVGEEAVVLCNLLDVYVLDVEMIFLYVVDKLDFVHIVFWCCRVEIYVRVFMCVFGRKK